MAKINTVIFDLGGVLIDWNPKYLYSKVFTNEKEIEFFLQEICHSAWNRNQDGGRTFSEAIQERIAVHPSYEQAIRCYFDRWEEMLGGSIETNVAILRQLYQQQKVDLYAITNWSHETFPIALDKYDFLQYFKDIVVSGSEKCLKPEKAIYKLLLERNSLAPGDCVFIDDVRENVEGAQDLGMAGIHLTAEADLATELRNLGIPI